MKKTLDFKLPVGTKGNCEGTLSTLSMDPQKEQVGFGLMVPGDLSKAWSTGKKFMGRKVKVTFEVLEEEE